MYIYIYKYLAAKSLCCLPQKFVLGSWKVCFFIIIIIGWVCNALRNANIFIYLLFFGYYKVWLFRWGWIEALVQRKKRRAFEKCHCYVYNAKLIVVPALSWIWYVIVRWPTTIKPPSFFLFFLMIRPVRKGTAICDLGDFSSLDLYYLWNIPIWQIQALLFSRIYH